MSGPAVGQGAEARCCVALALALLGWSPAGLSASPALCTTRRAAVSCSRMLQMASSGTCWVMVRPEAVTEGDRCA